MRLKKIKWYSGQKQNLAQALSSGVEFSFASPDNQQVCPFVYCKDYLQDAVQGFIHKKKKTIFGFVYDPVEHAPISINKTRLLVTNAKDAYFASKIRNCLDFLNQIEKDLKISKTTAKLCINPPQKYLRCGVWLFEGSSRWIKSPPMLSLYTLLIRLGFGSTVGTPYKETIRKIIDSKIAAYQSVDTCRLRESMNGINRILTEGDRKIFDKKIEKNYPKSIRVSTMHNTCGIIGFSTEKTKKCVPSWHKVES
ncbi:MAG: hypothetical protein ACHQUC_07065 [Chlamydiales bacterium]